MQLLGSWLMHLKLQDLIRDPSAPKVEVGSLKLQNASQEF
jgi:hypothetical protein